MYLLYFHGYFIQFKYIFKKKYEKLKRWIHVQLQCVLYMVRYECFFYSLFIVFLSAIQLTIIALATVAVPTGFVLMEFLYRILIER